MCASFADLLWESAGVLEQSRYSLRSNVCYGAHEKRVNIKMAIIMAATMISCSTTMWLEKAQPNAEHALLASRFSQALLQKSFSSKWWLSFKVKLGTSLKTNFQNLSIQ